MTGVLESLRVSSDLSKNGNNFHRNCHRKKPHEFVFLAKKRSDETYFALFFKSLCSVNSESAKKHCFYFSTQNISLKLTGEHAAKVFESTCHCSSCRVMGNCR